MTQGPFAIIRAQRIKSLGRLAALASHNRRCRDTPNADPSAPQPRPLIGSGDVEADAQRMLGQVERIGKGQVLAFEIFLGASPEYFRPGHPHDYGVFDDDQTRHWADRNVNWLRGKYGSLVVSAVLHLDEATPHIHAIVIPVERKVDRRCKPPRERVSLNARSLLNGVAAHSALQDAYAAAMAPLGLLRGKEKAMTKATHTAIRDFYRDPADAIAKAVRERMGGELEEARQTLTRLQRYSLEMRRSLVGKIDAALWNKAHAAAKEKASAPESTLNRLRTAIRPVVGSGAPDRPARIKPMKRRDGKDIGE